MLAESKYLVGGTEASSFLDSAQLDSGLNAMLGDPKGLDAYVGPDIQGAQITLRETAKKIAALVSDPTRTVVQKHVAAKQLAEKATTHLEKTKKALEARADHLKNAALAQAEMQLGPKSERGALHSEIRGWIREQAKSGDLSGIHAAIGDSDDVAAVLWHSPAFLLGLAPTVHGSIRIEALQATRPDLHADLSSSVELTKLATKYATAIRKVQVSFFQPSILEQASKRVEV